MTFIWHLWIISTYLPLETVICSVVAFSKINTAHLSSIHLHLPPTSVLSLSALLSSSFIPGNLVSILGPLLSREGDMTCSDSFHGQLSHLSSIL